MKFLKFETLLDATLEKICQLIISTILFYIFYRLIKLLIKHLFEKYSQTNLADSARVLTLSRLSQSLVQYLTLFLYLYTLLGILGLPVASLLAGAGIIGVAIGFAGRDLMSDVINGCFIIVEHQVNVGDFVAFKTLDLTGTVASIGIRSMTLTDASGAVIFIPNRNITALTNLSRFENRLFLDIPVNLENVDSLKKRMYDVNERHDNLSFVGVVTLEDKVYLRSCLTGQYATILAQKPQILAEYYQKND